jgi:glycosyltransferase involved in cell wall biosynthesis
MTRAEQLRVLLVNDYGTPSGGAELQMLGLREGLRKRGVDARLFATSADDGTGPNEADYRCFGSTSPLRTPLQAANPSAHLRLRRVLEAFRPDVVHVRLFLTQLSPLILPLLANVPSVYHAAWYRAVCPIGTKMLPDGSTCRVRAGLVCHGNGCLPWRNWPVLMGQRFLFRRWWHAFDRIIAVGGTVRDELVADGIGPVEVMWNPVAERPARPPLSGPPTVAFAGRLVREKGADVLLRAFRDVVAELPESRLDVLGAGPEAVPLAQLAAELGLGKKVRFLGHLPRGKAEERLASAWVQAVPSRWREPFGNAASEAMMRGTAVVASRSGGLADFVEEGKTGLLAQPGDPQSLAAALLRLLRDRELAEAMGRRARDFATTNLREDVYLDRMLALYGALSRVVPPTSSLEPVSAGPPAPSSA